MLEPLSALPGGELATTTGSVHPAEPAIRRGPVADRVRAGLNGIDLTFRAILVIALVIQLAIVLTGIVSRFWFDVVMPLVL
jgi:hypothetical protein